MKRTTIAKTRITKEKDGTFTLKITYSNGAIHTRGGYLDRQAAVDARNAAYYA